TRTVTTTSPAGRQSRVVFDTQGRPIDAYPPGIQSLHYTYDDRGRIKEVQQGARRTKVDYDSDGNAATLTAPDQKQSHTTYDALGRPLVVTRPDGKTLE